MLKKFILSFVIAALLAVSPIAVAQECALCDTVYLGNISEVKKLLEDGADTNQYKKHKR